MSRTPFRSTEITTRRANVLIAGGKLRMSPFLLPPYRAQLEARSSPLVVSR